ncbi:MAG: hypothetical protein NC912_05745 [Candidatus Omnitrophica bacterium]|nr:hypothetical protein [Candidatus Omnitrophota bacterium]
MKSNVKLYFSLLIFCLSLPFYYLEAHTEIPFDNPEATISLDLKDADLKDVLKIFSMQSGLNFIASESIQDRKVTLYFDKTPIKDAMEKFLQVNNLSYEIDRDSNIIIVKEIAKPEIETITKVFYLKYATVTTSSLISEINSQILSEAEKAPGREGEKDSGLSGAIKKLLSEKGSLIEDPRTNSLIVTDTPTRMSIIEKTISMLDVPTPMVVLEVEMLDVGKDKLDKLGVQWPSRLASLTVSGSRLTRFPFAGKGTSGKGYQIDPEKGVFDDGSTGYQWDFYPWSGNNFGPSIFTFIGNTLTLDFLRTQTDTKYLARPRLLTLNNATAEIKISTNESIGITNTSTEETGSITAEPERAETGVILRVTPQVNLETGEITMFIYPRVIDATTGKPIISGNQTYIFRDPEERSTKTTVRVKDGETLVIGGLIRTEFSQTTKKLPIFGDIPLLGALFRHKGEDSDKDRQRELLVFITPHIVKDSSFGVVQKINKVNSLTREQETTSVLQRNLVISSSLNSFEKR